MHNKPKIKTSEDKKREKDEISKRRAEEYSQLRNEFQEVKEKNKLDQEALKLTTKLLNMTSESYSIWNYRKKIIANLEMQGELEARQKLHQSELQWTQQLLVQHHKSYCIWYHRQWISRRMVNMDWEREIKLCNSALEKDQRNCMCSRTYILWGPVGCKIATIFTSSLLELQALHSQYLLCSIRR
eukprot:TRINITY_DN5264_c0_g1_i3.p1 TRINITY_DN5264_c0_g1~~TRINITY_DN5264_c0_g1_i3.p1  ORF type:complete len:199 (-),score=37.17 TRINITY_DN5264_c0_g1_i3:653-1207(-)